MTPYPQQLPYESMAFVANILRGGQVEVAPAAFHLWNVIGFGLGMTLPYDTAVRMQTVESTQAVPPPQSIPVASGKVKCPCPTPTPHDLQAATFLDAMKHVPKLSAPEVHVAAAGLDWNTLLPILFKLYLDLFK